MTRATLSLVTAIVVAGWCALFFTSSGVLYNADINDPGPGYAKTLICHYFTGIGTTRREHSYSPAGQIGGVDICPRLISFNRP